MERLADTATGRVRGDEVEGVLAFRSIPYAADTAGAARFLPPRPPRPWRGVRDATAFRGKAPQQGLAPAPRPELADFAGPPDTSPETEDCLTLNVWTPATDGAKRPVMVWFHGGAFSWGSSNAPRTWGMRLARKHDVVVVTVNQRLNIFGHLDLSLFGDAAYRDSGNAGTLDMLAALHWVRDNIAGFGGDPGCVTVFGESGGGAKVSVLLTMPRARGLFHRAIIQSGAAIRLRSRERALALTGHVVHSLGVATMKALRTMPVKTLLAAIKPAEAALGPAPQPLLDRYAFGPTADGDLVAGHPFDPGAAATMPDVPVIVGDMAQESAHFLAADDAVWHRTLTADALRSRIAPIAGKHTGEVLGLYDLLCHGLSPAETLIAITTDCNFRLRSWVLAQRRAALRQAPVWMYSFDWPTPVHGGRLGAPHAMDVPFTFNTLDLTNATGGSQEAEALSDTMATLWCTFARTGIPAAPGAPAWPPYDAARRATMILDRVCRIEDDPNAQARRLWMAISGTA